MNTPSKTATEKECCEKCTTLDQFELVCSNANCPCHSSPDKTEGWEGEFDAFIDQLPQRVAETPRNVLKAFISRTLEAQKREIHEDLLKKARERGCAMELEDLITSEINQM